MSDITVEEDTSLTPVEKETIIRWSKATDTVEIHSERATTGSLPKGCIKLSGSSRKNPQTSRMLGQLPEETNA